MKDYIINDCGVVINADIIFCIHREGNSTFSMKAEVGICQNGLWDFGSSFSIATEGEGKPCMLGKWKTKQEAIDNAILYIQNRLEYFTNKGFENQLKKAKNDFFYFRIKQHKPQTAQEETKEKTYIQTSLF